MEDIQHTRKPITKPHTLAEGKPNSSGEPTSPCKITVHQHMKFIFLAILAKGTETSNLEITTLEQGHTRNGSIQSPPNKIKAFRWNTQGPKFSPHTYLGLEVWGWLDKTQLANQSSSPPIQLKGIDKMASTSRGSNTWRITSDFQRWLAMRSETNSRLVSTGRAVVIFIDAVNGSQ
ncbi:hypothetical protein K2173_023819 [Erythroxylum novogranatense]|uniref:Uncharacterized protein n=1 Tax=Erythroxylum novogranatense TaxID=1862640 RepID=A0AAV8TI31_9ROSI|nr:hypothetical protein K2173_023819 [Erythroxylum novogranatense]